jgi:hypothetical protein
MKWAAFLKQEIENDRKATLALLDKVNDGDLAWRPSTGQNWMTMGQLLKHLTFGCGFGIRAFVTDDWTLPDGRKIEDIPAEEQMPTAEMLPSITSVDEAKRLFAEDIKLAIEMIDKAGEEDLQLRAVTAPWSPKVKESLGWMVHEMIQHCTSTKASCFIT